VKDCDILASFSSRQETISIVRLAKELLVVSPVSMCEHKVDMCPCGSFCDE
jgi:hypothetical protein